MLDRRKGASPLYFQLENLLKEQIEEGEYLKGDVFPTEKQLQKTYDVSRVTVRQAVSNLVNAGYLECHRGIGTIVVFQKIDEKLKQVISFSEEMCQHGIVMETSYCHIAKVKASKVIALNLSTGEQDKCYKLVRVRCAKGVPIVYSITYLKDNIAFPLHDELYKKSLYQLLKEEYGVQIVKGQDTLEAIGANKEISGFLEVEEGSPVFKRTRKTFDQKNETIEYTVCFYPGDKYKYSVEL